MTQVSKFSVADSDFRNVSIDLCFKNKWRSNAVVSVFVSCSKRCRISEIVLDFSLLKVFEVVFRKRNYVVKQKT